VFWRWDTAKEGQVLFLPIGAIRKNPQQPRRLFEPQALQDLADSIALYGVLQPLTVRKTEDGWELVAGERRLRAAKMAGLSAVPCLLVTADEEESGLLSIIENLQRKDLLFTEEARGIRNLMTRYGLSQEQVARRLGKSQSAVANKLRLLRHSSEVLEALEEKGLTERHARALLQISEDREKLELIARIAQEDWSVSRLEQYLRSRPQEPRFRWKSGMLKDVRLFLGSVEKALSSIRCAGFDAQAEKNETEKEIVLTIRLPKQLEIRN